MSARGLLAIVAVAVGTLSTAAPVALADEYCPPNPVPGHCYERVLLPGYSGYDAYGRYGQVRQTTWEWREVACGRGATPAADANRVVTSPGLVRAVQSALYGAGYYRGPSTGSADGATQQALNAFQADRGLPPGWNRETLYALGIAYGY